MPKSKTPKDEGREWLEKEGSPKNWNEAQKEMCKWLLNEGKNTLMLFASEHAHQILCYNRDHDCYLSPALALKRPDQTDYDIMEQEMKRLNLNPDWKPREMVNVLIMLSSMMCMLMESAFLTVKNGKLAENIDFYRTTLLRATDTKPHK